MILKRLRRGALRITDRGPTLYVWSSLAHYGLRALVLPTLRRNKEFVINEYNHDKRDEYWKPALSVDEFIYGDANTPTWVLIDDKLVRGTWHDVRARRQPAGPTFARGRVHPVARVAGLRRARGRLASGRVRSPDPLLHARVT